MGIFNLKLFFSLLLITILCGCNSMQNPSPHDIGDWRGNESIVIIGVPDTHRLFLRNGIQRDGAWEAKSQVLDGLHKPEHQYIITRLNPQQDNRYYGIEKYFTLWNKASEFRVCKGTETLVFNVPANQVIYVADISANTSDGTTRLSVSNKFDEAQKYLQEHYPRIANQLVQAKTTILPLANISCNFALTDFLTALSGAFAGAVGAL